jgi:hypothetical protein
MGAIKAEFSVTSTIDAATPAAANRMSSFGIKACWAVTT